MNLLDKITDKALKSKKKYLKYPALALLGMVDYAVGTHEEITGHKDAASAESTEDYQLYTAGLTGACLAEVSVFYRAIQYRWLPGIAAVGADIIVRDINLFANAVKRSKEFTEGGAVRSGINLTGIIGTARSLISKYASRSEPEPESGLEGYICACGDGGCGGCDRGRRKRSGGDCGDGDCGAGKQPDPLPEPDPIPEPDPNPEPEPAPEPEDD